MVPKLKITDTQKKTHQNLPPKKYLEGKLQKKGNSLQQKQYIVFSDNDQLAFWPSDFLALWSLTSESEH